MMRVADLGSTVEMIDLEDRWGAHNYHPLPVVVTRAEGPWVFDADGKRYLDCLSAYSAVNQGHCHPRILRALRSQAERVTLTSRAYRNDQLPHFCREVAELCGMEAVLPMNSGAEAVETAIKAARRWGYMRKGVPPGRAEIVVCENNFHGRTTTIVGFSSDPGSREGFGPFTPGFRTVPFGDGAALAEAITPDTCAFLFEPIQCEAGVLMPPDGYLAEAAAICRDRNVLLIADEIQDGSRPHGQDVRLRARGRAAGRVRSGQGAFWRVLPGFGRRVPPRGSGCVRPGQPWLHLRRQPARLRGRPRGFAGDRRGGTGGALRRAGAMVPASAGCALASGNRQSPRTRPAGRIELRGRPDRSASACRAWACSARRPTTA